MPKKIMPDYNLHQHSLFSDGKAETLDYVEKAIRLGFSLLGFSEHSPLPFNTSFSLKKERVQDYINEIDVLKHRFADKLEIFRSLEMDYIPALSEDFSYWADRCKTDYLIGSVHLVSSGTGSPLWFIDGPSPDIYDEGLIDFFGGDIKKALKAYFHQTNQMIETQRFDIIGHFDKIKMHNAGRYFVDEDLWYRKLIDETLELVKSKNLIVEINTRGLYKNRSPKLFPDDYALQRVKEMEIPIVISSDAHHPDELNGLFGFSVSYLKQIGFSKMMKYSNSQWDETNLS
ncbi:MAG: histidinol-phosphatase [Chlorobi bacterium]|nr:histidinol-phosphatase [Chlorobiota bacterium]